MDQRSYYTNYGMFDLAGATHRSLGRLPRALRDEFGYTYPQSLAAAFNDPAIDPRSGGIIGHHAVATALGRSLRQVQRSVFNTPHSEELRWAHNIPASHVSSLDSIRQRLDTAAHAAHLNALAIKVPTHCSSGNATG